MLFEKGVIEGVEIASQIGVADALLGTKKILPGRDHGYSWRSEQHGKGEAMTTQIELGGLGAVSARSFRETVDECVIVV